MNESVPQQELAPKNLSIDGEEFELVKTRISAPVSVYKGNGVFLRIGPKDLLQKELERHRNLVSSGFPVAEIMKEGEFATQYYFVEKSLGEDILGDVFWEDSKEQRSISEEHFDQFMSVTEKFATAQLGTIHSEAKWEDFYNGSHVDSLVEELPDVQERLLQAVAKAKPQLMQLPFVLTNDDINPYNLFKDGVIDMEWVFLAPAGLDIISNISLTYLFPDGGDYESTRRYSFSKEQLATYLAKFDEIYREAGVIEPSRFMDDFLFFRAVRSAVKMDGAPKIQQWRYDNFRNILDMYLRGESISDYIFNS